MIYSSLSHEELARWCYASPKDSMAKVELLRRAPQLVHGDSVQLQEVEHQRDQLLSEVESLHESMKYMIEV